MVLSTCSSRPSGSFSAMVMGEPATKQAGARKVFTLVKQVACWVNLVRFTNPHAFGSGLLKSGGDPV